MAIEKINNRSSEHLARTNEPEAKQETLNTYGRLFSASFKYFTAAQAAALVSPTAQRP
jgi:hypothetical protein